MAIEQRVLIIQRQFTFDILDAVCWTRMTASNPIRDRIHLATPAACSFPQVNPSRHVEAALVGVTKAYSIGFVLEISVVAVPPCVPVITYPPGAADQSPADRATVIQDAPIMLLPDAGWNLLDIAPRTTPLESSTASATIVVVAVRLKPLELPQPATARACPRRVAAASTPETASDFDRGAAPD
jgi:hypothetical protein